MLGTSRNHARMMLVACQCSAGEIDLSTEGLFVFGQSQIEATQALARTVSRHDPRTCASKGRAWGSVWDGSLDA